MSHGHENKTMFHEAHCPFVTEDMSDDTKYAHTECSCLGRVVADLRVSVELLEQERDQLRRLLKIVADAIRVRNVAHGWPAFDSILNRIDRAVGKDD